MLLVDASNVLHVTGVLPARLAGPGLAELAGLIAQSRYRGRPCILCCDGHGGEDAGAADGKIRVLFAGDRGEADDLLEDLVHRHRGASTTLVSSDRRVQRAGRKCRCRVLTSRAFLEQLVDDERRPGPSTLPAFAHAVPLDRVSVDLWLAEFGLRRQPGDAKPSTASPTRTPPPTAPPPASLASAAGRPAPAKPATGPVKAPKGAPQAPAENPGKSPAPARNATGKGPAARSGQPPGSAEISDPALARALREWGERIDPADLDMRRWVPDATPLRRPDEQP